MSILKDLLVATVKNKASDLHLKGNQVPFIRISGRLTEAGEENLSPEHMREIVQDILPDHVKEFYEKTHEADFSLLEEGAGRFRVNIFHSQGVPAVVMRHVKDAIPTFEDIRVPVHLKDMANVQRGIIILSGTTGSGKSTTLAALIGEINRRSRKRIITVEDPVEYQFYDEQSVISQREIGLDTPDHESALRHLLRQDPDVILIGEMRDQITIRIGLLAAETGHLVLSTLHAGTADQAIPRMLDVFPMHERDHIRTAIASNLYSIICQRLMKDVDGAPLPAVEILVNTSTVRKLITKNQLDVLNAAVETGGDDGMQTFNQSIYNHIMSGEISEEEGMLFATNPEALRMNLQGIFLDEGKRILGA